MDLYDILIQSICDVSNAKQETTKPIDIHANFGYNVIKKVLGLDPKSVNKDSIRIVRKGKPGHYKANDYGKVETVFKTVDGKIKKV